MQIDLEYFWKMFTSIVASLTIIMTFWKLIKEFKKNTAEAKAERRKKEKRQESLNTLADNIDGLLELTDDVKNIPTIMQMVEEIGKKQGEDYIQNIRQDRQIKESLEERDIMMRAQLAQLDFMISQGANGTAHASRDEIRRYQTKRAHAFDDYKHKEEEK